MAKKLKVKKTKIKKSSPKKKNSAKSIVKKKNIKKPKRIRKPIKKKLMRKPRSVKKTDRKKPEVKKAKTQKIKHQKQSRPRLSGFLGPVKKSEPVKQENFANLLEEKKSVYRPKIRVVGIGGGGGSIISEIAPRIKRVDFFAANTDSQALKGVAKDCKIFQFGHNLTYGLGCGMDPRVGAKAAAEEREKIAKIFQGVDLAILVASLGGGTSSGAVPEFVKAAKDAGSMSFGVFTMPFEFEGEKKSLIAKNALDKISADLNIFSIIPNDAIFQFIDKKTPLKEALSAVNKILAESLEGLVEMIYLPGLINIDFADLRSTLGDKGKLAYFKTAFGSGQDRAEIVSKELLRNPLNEYGIQGAEKILFNITASKDLKMKEVEQISREISDFNKKAQIIFGVSQDQKQLDNIRITLLAVGCGKGPEPSLKNKNNSDKPKKTEVKSKTAGLEQKTAVRPKSESKEKKPPELEKSDHPNIKKSRQGLKTSQEKKPLAKQREKAEKAKPISLTPKSSLPAELAKKQKEEKDSAAELNSQTDLSNSVLRQSSISPTRRNALELKKEIEHIEEEMLNQEKKWDIPAFLRKKRAAHQ